MIFTEKEKSCWIAKQYKMGWKIGFCFRNEKPSYVKYYFADERTVKKVLRDIAIVFIHMKGIKP